VSLVRFVDVYFSYNRQDYIFEKVNLSIGEYGVTGVISDIGKGKTTLLKLIKGILKPTAGSVIVMDIDTSRATKRQLMTLHSKVSISFQDVFLISNMNVFDNLSLPLLYNTNLSQKEVENMIDKVLDTFGISSMKYELPSDLSISESKIVSIARAFAGNPRIILLDDPFSLLDKYYLSLVIEQIQRKSKNSKIIFSTTNDSMFYNISDETIFIKDPSNIYLSKVNQCKIE
jgi:ABC-type transporter Mla maintaining outer membrane lipid asymmetry ATPase subunit MlaF